MHVQSSTSWDIVYVATTYASTAVGLALAVHALRHRDTRAALSFFAMTLIATLWSGMIVLSTIAPTIEQAAAWLDRKVIAVALAPVGIFAFICDYAGLQRWLTPRRLAPLLVMPALTITLVLVDPDLVLTHDVRSTGRFFLEERFTLGPWFWVQASYSYGLTVISLFVLIVRLSQWFDRHRFQGLLIVAGLVIPTALNVLRVLGALRPPGDLTVLGFCVTALIWGWALFRFRLVEIMPVAFSKLIEEMKDGVAVSDANGHIVYRNAAFQEMFPIPTDRLEGEVLSSLLPQLQNLLEREEAAQAELELAANENESTRTFDVNASPIHDQTGSRVGQCIVLRDISERVRLTRDLDAYAHAVAHDLKNPIGVVSGYIDLLGADTESSISEEGHHFLAQATQGCAKSTQIVNELLLLASVRNVQDISTRALDTSKIVNDVQLRLQEEIRRSGATVASPDRWPAASGHAPWVEEVWANYLSNAIKYGGTPPIVELGSQPLPDGRVHFWVRDNGSGLNAEQVQKLFREFSRLHPGKAEGNGLGLSIVKRVVEKLSGEVTVESTPGAGSTFGFILPAAADPDEEGAGSLSRHERQLATQLFA